MSKNSEELTVDEVLDSIAICSRIESVMENRDTFNYDSPWVDCIQKVRLTLNKTLKLKKIKPDE